MIKNMKDINLLTLKLMTIDCVRKNFFSLFPSGWVIKKSLFGMHNANSESYK